MLIRLSVMLAAVALVAACHGNGQAEPGTGTMGTPGMYFRATPPLSPVNTCAPASTETASCSKHSTR
jgi:hypothetical protein